MDNGQAELCLERMESKEMLGLRITCNVSAGDRDFMEDAVRIHFEEVVKGSVAFAFIAVFDGHGGENAARFAKVKLFEELTELDDFWSDNDDNVCNALKEAFAKTHHAMWKEIDNWPKSANGYPSTSGSTATVAIIRENKLYVAHVGDSTAVICHKSPSGTVIGKHLTEDHKPDHPAERSRIQSAGGYVEARLGINRVVWCRPKPSSLASCERLSYKEKITSEVEHIPFLAVSRSLGDLWSYNPARDMYVVSPEPDISVKTITPGEHFAIIFATDGLWNVISANDAAHTVAKHCNGKSLHTNVDIAAELVTEAVRICRQRQIKSDNVSVVCTLIGPAETISAPCLRSDCLLVRTVPFKGKIQQQNNAEDGAPTAKRSKHLMQIDGVVRTNRPADQQFTAKSDKRKKPPSPPSSPGSDKGSGEKQPVSGTSQGLHRSVLSAIKGKPKIDSDSPNSPSSSSDSVAQTGSSFIAVEPVVGGR